MSAAAPLTFPGGRAVAGWWRQLSPYQPRSLWIAQLLLHRVEALVRVRQAEPVAPHLASALSLLERSEALTPAELGRRLFVDPAQARQLLLELAEHGWAAGYGSAWSVTERGRAACRGGGAAIDRAERRAFHFLDRAGAEGNFHFLRLNVQARQPAAGEVGGRFQLGQLADCVRQSADWKVNHGFPTEVIDLVGPSPASTHNSDDGEEWRRLVIDYPERLPSVLVLTERDGVEQCLGFEFQQQGWHLHTGAPAFALGACWRDTFPELTRPVPLELWRESWEAWLQSRGVADAGVGSCNLRRSGYRLHVGASASLLQRFRAIIRPAVQGDIWLLAGAGRFREAVHVELAPAPQVA